MLYPLTGAQEDKIVFAKPWEVGWLADCTGAGGSSRRRE